MSNRLTFSLASLIVLLALGLVFVATPANAAEFATGAKINDISVVQGQKLNITFPTAMPTEPAGTDATANPAGAMSAVLVPSSGSIAAVAPPVAPAVGTPIASGDFTGALFTFDPATGIGKLTGNANPALVGRQIVTYTVAETDGGDDDTDAAADVSLTFAFEVTAQTVELTFGNATITDKELTVGDAFSEVLPAATSGSGIGPLTYSIRTADDTADLAVTDGLVSGAPLPPGITFRPASRVLGGTPTGASGRAIITYQVADSTATSVTKQLRFTITVKARPTMPSFAESKVPDAAYTKGHAIVAMTLPEADDTYSTGALTYDLKPLPKGLMFNAATRMLTGTPTEAKVVDAMYSATDEPGQKAEIPFKITVNDVVSVTAIANQSVTLGSNDAMKMFTTVMITAGAGGTGAKTFTVANLPDGVTFDGKDKIMGTPSRAAAASTEVTVTATDTLMATGMTKFTITVTKPKNLAFNQVGFTDAIAPRVFTVGQVIAPTALPSGMDGISPYTYDLANVPAGLTFDNNTRLLSGTPTAVQAAMDHTYTVTDDAFSHVTSPNSNQMPTSITLPISITVKRPAPAPDTVAPTFSGVTIASLVATVGTEITGRVLPRATDSDTPADELMYTLESAAGMDLPAGLMFDDERRTLTGTPTAAMAQTAYVYKVEDSDGNYDDITFFITVNAVAPPPGTPTPTRTLAAGGFVVFVRDLDNAPEFGTASPMLAEWAAMPNLHQLFTEGGGGSLQLTVAGANARQVVFSEVMWAVDEGKVGQPSYMGEQWIEIHNRMSTPVPIPSISFATSSGRPALPQNTDLISNVVGAGDDWIKAGKGQNGNSGVMNNGVITGQTPFKSMYRHRFHNDSAGWVAGEWREATNVYHPNHYGTPGRAEPARAKIINPSSVRLETIINEVGNYSAGNSSHEWIELRHVRGGKQHFENWVVDMVTGVNQQTRLFKLPKLENKYDNILLITKTDPYRDDNHPLRGGYDVTKNFDDQKNEGRDSSIRYYVAKDWTTDLPANGEFVLILRHGNDKTNHEKVEDIAGWHPNLKVDTATDYTNLWPLVGYPAPVSNKNAIVEGAVHRRQHDGIVGTGTVHNDKKDDQVALRDHGWTGVGYKRNAAAGNQNGGTPGYPNNAPQSNETQAGADPVIISEIMYATGERGNIPQWIELRNTSQTVGINLDGWRLTVVNHDQDDAAGTKKFPGDLVKHYAINGKISPGETFLIVAHSGTHNTKLPRERIHAVFNRRGQHILSQYGFEITLLSRGKDEKDENRKVADTVGNLASATGARVRANPQSYETPAWMLPMGMTADGNRVSIVRVAKLAKRLGQTAGAWKRFDETAHLNAPESTYYGNRNDLSNPGYTVGGPLPVSLSKFRPERMKDTGDVVIRWVTESETNNAGFNILRSEALDGEFTKLHFKAGQGTTTERTAYEWTDKSAKPNVVYYYQIQDISLDGEVNTLKTTHLRGNVSAVGKATTTWGEIKALQ